MGLKIDYECVIKDYNNGASLNELARAYGTYPTTITRILKEHHIPLRHDARKKGEFYVKDGNKLIEWAKSQGRLVTKAELAAVLGKSRLSHSYFEKYPELGQYIKNYSNNELNIYIEKVAKFLQDNDIYYKPNDKTKLGVSVDFLLLGEYSNIALQIDVKPHNISIKRYRAEMYSKSVRADLYGVYLLLFSKKDLENETDLKRILNEMKEDRKTCIL